MSAWLCGNKTLSCVVDIIQSNDFKKNYDIANEYCNKEKNELIDILSDLNTKSLNCRYGASEDNVLKDRKYVYLNVPIGQKFKSVSCYLYQTCECEDNLSNPLFHLLEKWSDDRFDLFECDWDKYEWDIDSIQS